MLFSGIVLGAFVAKITAGIPFLEWLSFGLKFGTDAPLNIDLGVLTMDFGISINLTISCIICVFVAMIIGKKVL